MFLLCTNILEKNFKNLNILFFKLFVISVIASCGGKVYLSSGRWLFTSPNFPNNYEPHAYCVWDIIDMRPSHLNLLSLSFPSFHLEGKDMNGTCSNDYVVVYRDDYPVNTLCGRQNDTKTWHARRSFRIVFMSNGANQFKGFLASFWRSKCIIRLEVLLSTCFSISA